MRILLLSDTHNDTNRIDDVLAQCGSLDMIIHCGDMERDFEYITCVVPPHLAMLAVCGNNDWQSDLPYFRIVELEGVRFYITHGHLERVKRDWEGLIRKAHQNDCQAVLFGHTHQRTDQRVGNIHIINPGSLCYPGCSYAILTVAEGKLSAEFFDLP